MGFTELIHSDELRTGTRVLQIVWAAVMLGCSAYLVITWIGEIEDLDVNPTRYTSPMGFAVFAAALCLAATLLFLGASRAGDQRIQRVLPGIVDLVASCALALLALVAAGAVGNSFAMHVTCNFSAYVGDLDGAYTFNKTCSVSRAAVVSGVILAVLFAGSAMMAFHDMRAGKGLLPRGKKPTAVDVNEAPEGDKDIKTATSQALEAEEGKHAVEIPPN